MTYDHSLRIVFLASGSRGNAAAITDGETTLLLDCGISARECTRRLASAGLDAAHLSAVLVTHEHTDHTRGIEVLARQRGCRVLASAGTLRASGLEQACADTAPLAAGEETRVGTLRVLPFRTSHDAAQPLGYRIEDARGTRIGVVTDTGVLTPEAVEALGGVDLLGIESNHDLDMLERGPYPAFLKARIRSARGHLSNADAAEAIERLATDRLHAVFGLHRSETNNTAARAERALSGRLARLGLDIPVRVAAQSCACDSAAEQTSLPVGDVS